MTRLESTLEIDVPSESELDEDGSLFLREYTVTYSGKWRVHMNDADKWPSDFHAHNVDDCREKLDLYTGIVFNVLTKYESRRLTKKQMRFIYETLRTSGNEKIQHKCTADSKRFKFLPTPEPNQND